MTAGLGIIEPMSEMPTHAQTVSLDPEPSEIERLAALVVALDERLRAQGDEIRALSDMIGEILRHLNLNRPGQRITKRDAFFVLWPASLSVLLWHYHRHRLALARQRVGGAMPLALQSPWRLRALQLNAVMALFVSVTLIFISLFFVAETFVGVPETFAVQSENFAKLIVGIALLTLLLTLPLGFAVWLAALAFIFVQRKPYPWDRTSGG